MGKVILFEKSNYDTEGNYQSYNTDNLSTNYVLIYNDPTNPLEVNSIMTIDTDYCVTLLYVNEDKIITFMHVNSMPDIKNGVDSRYKIKT